MNVMFRLLEGEATPAGSSWISIAMIAVMFALVYFFMIRPQKKQEKEKQDMQSGLAVGDEVTTIGGIIGQIVSIKGETFVLETTKDKTKIRFLKGAVRSVDVKASDKAASVLEYQEVPAEELPVAEPVEAPVEEAPAEETQD
jgi:preprotein translocase subunit YajC